MSPTDFGNSDRAEGTVIKLERHGLGDLDPVYSLTIFGDGTIVYDGIKHVKVKGIQRARISEISVKELVDQFINIYYFALKDRYGESEMSNQSYVATSLTLDCKTKKVFRHHGSQAPRGLQGLEDSIDITAKSNQWTGLPS